MLTVLSIRRVCHVEVEGKAAEHEQINMLRVTKQKLSFGLPMGSSPVLSLQVLLKEKNLMPTDLESNH